MQTWSSFERLLPIVTAITKLPDPRRDGFGDRKIEFAIELDASRLPRLSGETDREAIERLSDAVKADLDRGKTHRFQRCHIEIPDLARSIRVIAYGDVYDKCLELFALARQGGRNAGLGS